MPVDPSRIEVMDERTAEILRRKTPAERLAIGHAMGRSMRRMLRHFIQSKHPDWTNAQIQMELARRMHVDEIPNCSN